MIIHGRDPPSPVFGKSLSSQELEVVMARTTLFVKKHRRSEEKSSSCGETDTCEFPIITAAGWITLQEPLELILLHFTEPLQAAKEQDFFRKKKVMHGMRTFPPSFTGNDKALAV